MSDKPFELFQFDGIMGMGLSALALSKEYSWMNVLMDNGLLPHPHFGVFLTEGGDGEESEITIGGHNPKYVQEPLSWVNLTKPELGYWLVEIVAIRVNGVELDVCKSGTCAGILDTGTSHLGVPAHSAEEMEDLLTLPSGDLTDCRQSAAPIIEIQLTAYNLTLHPENYMRKLPLAEDTMNDTNVGVSPTSYLDNTRESLGEESGHNMSNSSHASHGNVSSSGNMTESASHEEKFLCTPKLLPVTWPEPLGPNLFILGEPVLHRYYTVFDWGGKRAGFGVSKHGENSPHRRGKEGKAKKTVEDDVILFQVTISVTLSKAKPAGANGVALESRLPMLM
jgi:hypothetical protein